MKHSLAFLLAVGFLAGLGAPRGAAGGVPQQISYQGRLSHTSIFKLTKGVYIIQTRIWDNRTGGQVLWGQAYPVTVDSNGMFNVNLGDGGGATSPAPVYSTLAPALDGGDRFLGITVVQTPAGSVSAPKEMTPRMQLLSSPYALRTAIADVALNYQGLSPSQLASLPSPPAPSPSVRPVLGFDGVNYATSSLVYDSTSNSVLANVPLQIQGVLSAPGGVQATVQGGTNGVLLGDNVTAMSYGASLGWSVNQSPSVDCFLVVPWYSDPNYTADTKVSVSMYNGTSWLELTLTIYSGPPSAAGNSHGFTLLPIPANMMVQPYVMLTYSPTSGGTIKPNLDGLAFMYLWQ
ncbi:MAG: hypothetical protein WCT12_09370 [Verrucomicrobiota bacterium]